MNMPDLGNMSRRNIIKALAATGAAGGAWLTSLVPELASASSGHGTGQAKVSSLTKDQLQAAEAGALADASVKALAAYVGSLGYETAPSRSSGASITMGSDSMTALGIGLRHQSDASRSGLLVVGVGSAGQIVVGASSLVRTLANGWECEGAEVDLASASVRAAGITAYDTRTQAFVAQIDGRQTSFTRPEMIKLAQSRLGSTPHSVTEAGADDCCQLCIFLAGLALTFGCGYVVSQAAQACLAFGPDPGAAGCIALAIVIGTTGCFTLSAFGVAAVCNCITGCCCCC